MVDVVTPSGGRRRWILIAALVVIVAGAFVAWRYLVPRETTDDAQVSGHVSPVASRVGGAVIAVHVVENQVVGVGDVLVEIDPRDYRVALARADADLAGAVAALAAARTGIPITSTESASGLKAAEAGAGNAKSAVLAASMETESARAKLASAQARLQEMTAKAAWTTQDLDRMKQLIAKDEVSRQQYDAAVAADSGARAAVDSARAAITEAEANVRVADARHAQAESALTEAEAQAKSASTAPEQVALTEARANAAEAQLDQAKAARDQAELNLDRTTIRAAVAGVVSRKSVEVGQLVQPGQSLFAIVALDDVWVTANFKETQVANLRTGQQVDVTVDGNGSRTYHARVDSISAATGATFSLLPAENASGNFVKVVQRVPVKIALDAGENADHSLRPGMSAYVSVHIQ